MRELTCGMGEDVPNFCSAAIYETRISYSSQESYFVPFMFAPCPLDYQRLDAKYCRLRFSELHFQPSTYLRQKEIAELICSSLRIIFPAHWIQNQVRVQLTANLRVRHHYTLKLRAVRAATIECKTFTQSTTINAEIFYTRERSLQFFGRAGKSL